MSMKRVTARHVAGGAALSLVLLAAAACAPGGATTTTSASGECRPAKSPVITLAAYSTPYDAYGKLISTWSDLTRPGLQVLTPDPAQSGGARWNIVAAYGASMRGKVPGYGANSTSSAQTLLTSIFKNVTVMDKSANDSLKNFQSGNGDVAISYENQILLSKASGTKDQLVLPPSTVLVQNPTVVVDKNAQKHCVLPIANAFVSWLHTSKALAILGKVGYFRPVNL